jgi:ABC-2 type transport system permease protein
MNTGLSLVIFIFLSAALIIKFDEAANMLIEQTPELSIDFLRSILPAVYFGLICMGSFMTFITCSMVSLEGKMFYYLKSLPIKPATLLFAKILTSLLFVTPLMLAFDVLMVYHFQFDFLSSIAIFAASFIFPAITACIGILLNLRYPKLDFESEAEVVKQSMSTLISSVLAILMTVVSIALIATLIALQLPIPAVLWIITGAYSLICALLYLLINKVGIKLYYKIK